MPRPRRLSQNRGTKAEWGDQQDEEQEGEWRWSDRNTKTPGMANPLGSGPSAPRLFYRWDLLVMVVVEVILEPEPP